MKLYGNIRSERAEKGQGGNDYLEIKVTNDKRLEVVTMKVTPGDKAKIFVCINQALAEVEVGKNQKCECSDPLCAKCLLVNCTDPNCKAHPEEKKIEFRELYKKR